MNKKTIIGIICIIVVIAIIGAVYFLTGNNSNENNANQTISDSNVNSNNAEDNNVTGDENQAGDTTNEGLKTLVVYFSVPETNSPSNMTQDEENSTVIVDGEVLGS